MFTKYSLSSLGFVSLLCCGLAISGCQAPPSPEQDSQSSSTSEPSKTVIPEENSSGVHGSQISSKAILEDLITQKDQLKLCEEIPFDSNLARKNPLVYDLGERKSLVTVVCGMVDGQFVHENYLYDANTTKPTVIPLRVALMTIDAQRKMSTMAVRSVEGYGQYDVAENMMKITTMFDQLGDCGMVGFYQLKDKKFEVQKLFAKPDCTTGYIDPLDYPQVYP